ncbi:hypothetical protein [Streptomyces sp. NTK 937]|uniref:hypothetical protein n=1 Tax=Streptomyces sp. NTK 937 TaxID=1487711 RepID=UPI0004A8E00E|nr:hypothetical protein [Streptomyces sp. NTK 937]KDQ65730.1 hypothetical protein DT87_00290 [Streptomyces sp. NTK 937]
MADPIDLTTDVQAYALGTLAEWIKGYTVPEEGPQQKYTLRAVGEDDRSIDVQVETCDPFPSDPKVFRIWLEVEAL